MKISKILLDRICKPKNKIFYEIENNKRHYFYYLDTRGQLFLEDIKQKNITSCLKDNKILNFIFNNLNNNNTLLFNEIPLISYCGKEINFITPADIYSKIVFKDLNWNTNKLIYGGNLEHDFNPSLLVYNPISGRVYHPILEHRYLNGNYGLLHPNLCQKVGEHISTIETSLSSLSSDLNQLNQSNYILTWNNEQIPIKTMITNDENNDENDSIENLENEEKK